MAFLGIKSQSQKEKESAIKNLIVVMLADGRIDENEKAYLGSICNQYGITIKQLEEILKKPQNIKFTVPKEPSDRMQQLIEIVLMMMIDGDIDRREMDICISLAVQMGFKPSAVPQLVQNIVNEIKQKAETQQVNVNININVNDWL